MTQLAVLRPPLKGRLNYMKKSRAQDFADTMKDDPQKIINWAKREIREYQKLIKILESKKKKPTKKSAKR